MLAETSDISKSAKSHDRGSSHLARPQKIGVAYIMSWFPKLSETFVLREMIEMEKLGHPIEVFPLRKGDTTVLHADAQRYVQKANFVAVMSWSIIFANMLAFLRNPIRYLSIVWTLFWENLGSMRYLVGAFVFLPKAVYLASVIERKGIQHVHAHFASHPATVAYVIHRLTGIPYSFTAHGSDLHRDQHMLAEKCRLASTVITISDYNKKFINQKCNVNSDKVQVVNCGILLDKYAELLPRQTDDQSVLNLICVGTLHEVKGQSFLIEACKILESKGVNFRCRFIGDGPDRQELEKQSQESGLGSKIEFLGACVEDEVRKWMSQSDVLVCPSVMTKDGRREGIPVVLMEAMACGLPCVASDISGIPEIVIDNYNGFLSQAGDPNSIVEAILKINSNESSFESLSRNSRETVSSRFDLKQNVHELSKLIQSVQEAQSVQETKECK